MKERDNCNNMGKTSDYIYRMLLYWTLASVKLLAWASGGYLKKKKHLKNIITFEWWREGRQVCEMKRGLGCSKVNLW